MEFSFSSPFHCNKTARIDFVVPHDSSNNLGLTPILHPLNSSYRELAFSQSLEWMLSDCTEKQLKGLSDLSLGFSSDGMESAHFVRLAELVDSDYRSVATKAIDSIHCILKSCRNCTPSLVSFGIPEAIARRLSISLVPDTLTAFAECIPDVWRHMVSVGYLANVMKLIDRWLAMPSDCTVVLHVIVYIFRTDSVPIEDGFLCLRRLVRRVIEMSSVAFFKFSWPSNGPVVRCPVRAGRRGSRIPAGLDPQVYAPS
jgi:hypothetical protein